MLEQLEYGYSGRVNKSSPGQRGSAIDPEFHVNEPFQAQGDAMMDCIWWISERANVGSSIYFKWWNDRYLRLYTRDCMVSN